MKKSTSIKSTNKSTVAAKKVNAKKGAKVMSKKVIKKVNAKKTVNVSNVIEKISKTVSSPYRPKIGKAAMIKDRIFSLARKAEFTRKEVGAILKKEFTEYAPSTLSTYISDSFNAKYCQGTGCKRMLKYTEGNGKRIITVM